MFYPRIKKEKKAKSGRFLWAAFGLCMVMVVVMLAGCQKSEAPPSSSSQQKAVPAAPVKDPGAPDANELNYDKAMAKQYPADSAINVTGKVMQLVDEKTILVATRKDDVFGYLDNIVTIIFPEKPNLGVGDIIQFKTKNAGIRKYKTEGKGEYDAPFLNGESFTILEKGKPTK